MGEKICFLSLFIMKSQRIEQPVQVKQKGVLIFKEEVTEIIHMDFKKPSRNNWDICIHQL